LAVSKNNKGIFGNNDCENEFLYRNRLSINDDGRFIAFASRASNFNKGTYYKVYVYDSNLDNIKLISKSSKGITANGPSYSIRINKDGRFIFYGSEADNLVINDNNNEYDIFRHDTLTSNTIRVSISPTLTELKSDEIPCDKKYSIDSSGNIIVFVTGKYLYIYNIKTNKCNVIR